MHSLMQAEQRNAQTMNDGTLAVKRRRESADKIRERERERERERPFRLPPRRKGRIFTETDFGWDTEADRLFMRSLLREAVNPE